MVKQNLRIMKLNSTTDSKGQPTGEIEPLNLTAEEHRDLLAFLECLNSPLPPVETGRLPRD
jgi:hypothetical protein